MTFSVVIPTHNRAHLIRRAIDSVLAQTYADFELIVVDDGSVDGTADVVQAVADERLRFVRLRRNLGVCAARDAGVRVARGSHVTFLDSDDELLPRKLEAIARLVERADDTVGVFFTNMIQVRDLDSGEVPIRKTHLSVPSRESAYHHFLRERPVGFGAGPTFLRQALIEAGPFDGSLTSIEDKDMLLRVFRLGYSLAVHPGHLHKKHEHASSQITTELARSKGPKYERLYAKHHDVLDRHPALAACAANKIATLHHQAGNIHEAAEHIRKAVQAEPTRPKWWIKWLMYSAAARRVSADLVSSG